MKPPSVERRLFDLSLGGIRLLDTTLTKAGLPELATLLRDLVIGWRAYPSRTRFSQEDLRGFENKLGKIAAGLRTNDHPREPDFVLGVLREIKCWKRASQ